MSNDVGKIIDDLIKGRLIQIDLVELRDIPTHPLASVLRPGVLEWLETVPDRKPQCFCCDHRWSSKKDELPLLFVVIVKGGVVDGEGGLLSAICRACVIRSGTRDRICRSIRQVFPGIQELELPILPFPNRVQ